VWLVNRDDKATLRPNVAAVGAGVDDAAASSSSTSVDPMGSVGAQYLDGTAAPADATSAVTPMVGTADGHVIATATAVFRRNVTADHTCLYSGVPAGSRVTVVNVDNSRSMTCATTPRPPDQPRDELVMSAAAFAAIADPSSAPIDIEIKLRP
jgi:hypothetical protein